MLFTYLQAAVAARFQTLIDAQQIAQQRAAAAAKASLLAAKPKSKKQQQQEQRQEQQRQKQQQQQQEQLGQQQQLPSEAADQGAAQAGLAALQLNSHHTLLPPPLAHTGPDQPQAGTSDGVHLGAGTQGAATAAGAVAQGEGVQGQGEAAAGLAAAQAHPHAELESGHALLHQLMACMEGRQDGGGLQVCVPLGCITDHTSIEPAFTVCYVVDVPADPSLQVASQASSHPCVVLVTLYRMMSTTFSKMTLRCLCSLVSHHFQSTSSSTRRKRKMQKRVKMTREAMRSEMRAMSMRTSTCSSLCGLVLLESNTGYVRSRDTLDRSASEERTHVQSQATAI